MAERKATNKYYPPEWEPKHGSINKFRGQHPLRERARKLSQGILIIRFEMPYNIWCEGCKAHIGMGVRYNAEKRKIGNYHSTIIYEFKMKCHLCPNFIVIKTNPEERDYTIVSGAKRKTETYAAEDAETYSFAHLIDKEHEQLADKNDIEKLEKEEVNIKKAKEEEPRLRSLLALRQERGGEDWGANWGARKILRKEKKEEKEEREDRFARNIYFPFVEESEEEREKSKDEFYIRKMLSTSSSSSSLSRSSSSSSLLKTGSMTKAGSIFGNSSAYTVKGKAKDKHDTAVAALKRSRSMNMGGVKLSPSSVPQKKRKNSSSSPSFLVPTQPATKKPRLSTTTTSSSSSSSK